MYIWLLWISIHGHPYLNAMYVHKLSCDDTRKYLVNSGVVKAEDAACLERYVQP